jgi:hypothetical protein
MITLTHLYWLTLLAIALLLVVPSTAFSEPLVAVLLLALAELLLLSKSLTDKDCRTRPIRELLLEGFNGCFGERTQEWIKSHNERAFIMSRFEREDPLANLKPSESRLKL